MSDESLRLLGDVFRAVFEIPAGEAVDGVTQEATEAWDSLGHVTLITALESEFDVQIDPADSIEITSFEAAADILGELLTG